MPATRSASAVLAVAASAVLLASAAAQPASPAQAATPAAAPDAAPKRTDAQIKKYELGKDRLAIDGYDPVAYFPEGDPKGKGAAVKGDKKFELEHEGVRYRFSSQKNLDLFKANPRRYEPAHGGWCSYAAAKGAYTEPSPKNFIVREGRVFLFYKDIITDTKKLWEQEGAADLERKADAWWNTETGETPRNVRLDAEGQAINE